MVEALVRKVLEGGAVERAEALALARGAVGHTAELMEAARRVRRAWRGDRVGLCAIINAKSGRCAEDCRFCAQASRYQTATASYPLVSEERILEGAERAGREGAGRFCIVTSGRRPTAGELDRIARVLASLRAAGRVRPCASLGILDRDALVRLKAAGLIRYHHNIETAESFYSSVCSTHSFTQRINTVRAAKSAGLEVCSGGILGLGETMAQRVEMALTLRDLEVDAVPLNLLRPIPGTPLEGMPRLSREEILASVALFRLILPRAEIRACAGREFQLGGDQGLLLDAGVDGILTGDYLTTSGTAPARDRAAVVARGLILEREV